MKRAAPQSCWLWLRAKTEGYGVRNVDGKVVLVHRALWEEINGPIPAWGELHHLCRTRSCYRSDHLIVVSRLARIFLERDRRKKDFCRHGHSNSIHQATNILGKKFCRPCATMTKRAYKQRQREMGA